MKKAHLFWIIPLSMVVGFILIIILIPTDSNEDELEWGAETPQIGHYWTCMDGCFWMEQIILGEIDSENETQRAYHEECSDICFEQLITLGGNYTR